MSHPVMSWFRNRLNSSQRTRASSVSPFASFELNENKALWNLRNASRYLVLIGAGLYICVCLVLAFYRVPYKFELEWLEGGSVDHVRRILCGQALYGPPSLGFTPYEYTPLYYYVSSLVARVTGIGFLPLRLVSFASAMASLYLIFLIVRKETTCWYAAFISACLMAASFKVTGGWFDVARVDCLFLLIILLVIYTVRFYPTRCGSMLGGLLMAAAFFTKQTTLVVAFPLMLYLLFFKRRQGVLVIIVAGCLIVLTAALFEVATGGWFTYYILYLGKMHPFVTPYHYFWRYDILPAFSLAGAVGLFYVMRNLYNGERWVCMFYACAIAGMLGGSWYSRMSQGGHTNVLLPACAGISILFGLGVDCTLRTVRMVSPGSRMRAVAEVYLYLVFGLQFVALLYNPFGYIPKSEDLRAGNAFIKALGELPGDILLVHHGYYASMAGKETHAQQSALGDVLRCNDGTAAQLADDIRTQIRTRKFTAIILDEDWQPFQDSIEKSYSRKRRVFQNMNVFHPVAGGSRPELIYVLESETAPGTGTFVTGSAFAIAGGNE